MWYIKSGVNTGWYLKELELLQANMTVQWLKQKLKVFATTAKYGMIELQSGNKQELQKIDLLINVFVQYWKNSWTTCLDHSLLFIVFLLVWNVLLCNFSVHLQGVPLCPVSRCLYQWQTLQRNRRKNQKNPRHQKEKEEWNCAGKAVRKEGKGQGHGVGVPVNSVTIRLIPLGQRCPRCRSICLPQILMNQNKVKTKKDSPFL